MNKQPGCTFALIFLLALPAAIPQKTAAAATPPSDSLTTPILRVSLTSPAYRGRITPDGPDRIRLRVRVNQFPGTPPLATLRLHATLQDAATSRVIEKSDAPPAPNEHPIDFDWPAKSLPPGRYRVLVRLNDAKGNTLQTAIRNLTRFDKTPPCPVYIDQHRRLIVHGQPFFPLGMYWGEINQKDIKTFADSKFNCLMPYTPPTRKEMDLAARYGLKVVYSLKDFYAGTVHCPPFIKSKSDEEPKMRSRIREFRNHPALLAWYLNDELSLKYLPRLRTHQHWVQQEDPNHPTWVVLYQVKNISYYTDTFDVIGSDPYPITRESPSLAGQWTAETRRQVDDSRPIWEVPQAFDWGVYHKDKIAKYNYRSPTFDEMRSMAWQCICQGANGLVFYSFFDLKRAPDVPFDVQWEKLKRIAAEIHRMIPVLLSIEPVPPIQAICTPKKGNWLDWTARRKDGTLYLFAVNNGNGQGKATFSNLAGIKTATEHGKKLRIPVTHGMFSDTLKRLDVKIYELR